MEYTYWSWLKNGLQLMMTAADHQLNMVQFYFHHGWLLFPQTNYWAVTALPMALHENI